MFINAIASSSVPDGIVTLPILPVFGGFVVLGCLLVFTAALWLLTELDTTTRRVPRPGPHVRDLDRAA
jgi:hypothetical protein